MSNLPTSVTSTHGLRSERVSTMATSMRVQVRRQGLMSWLVLAAKPRSHHDPLGPTGVLQVACQRSGELCIIRIVAFLEVRILPERLAPAG